MDHHELQPISSTGDFAGDGLIPAEKPATLSDLFSCAVRQAEQWDHKSSTMCPGRERERCKDEAKRLDRVAIDIACLTAWFGDRVIDDCDSDRMRLELASAKVGQTLRYTQPRWPLALLALAEYQDCGTLMPVDDELPR